MSFSSLNFVKLNTPLSEKDVRSLRIGDIVRLTGKIFICRDRAHRRIVDEYIEKGRVDDIPFNLKGQIIFHTGSIIEKRGGKWTVIVTGSTTSAKLESVEYLLIKRLKLRGIIGKGGMGLKTTSAMKQHGCVYLSTVGGAAALLTEGVKEVLNVHWLDDFGITEAVWHLRVDDFGPLIVGIDSYGRNIYEENRLKVLKEHEKQVQTQV